VDGSSPTPSPEKSFGINTVELSGPGTKYQCQYQYEWGGRTRRLMHRGHLPIYFVSPSALFRQ
jgi:hypothetical protein